MFTIPASMHIHTYVTDAAVFKFQLTFLKYSSISTYVCILPPYFYNTIG